MKKFSSLITLFLTAVTFLTVTPFVYADSICATGQFAPLCTLTLNNAGSTTGRIVTILLILAVVLALIFLVYNGIRWITSGGDKGKVDQARAGITAAVIGLILALMAYFILNVVVYLFTKQTLTNISIPTIVP